MQVFWDEIKNRRNRAKHKVSFETVLPVFSDPHAICRPERNVEGEERWQTIGLVGGTRILVVAHTYSTLNDEEVIRIISARKASPSERKKYAEGIQ